MDMKRVETTVYPTRGAGQASWGSERERKQDGGSGGDGDGTSDDVYDDNGACDGEKCGEEEDGSDDSPLVSIC